ncbi:MAG: TetR family transcriptional regulator [Propionibacteriaceae bacterium]|nr:TetR family transcriptional regulator [Propionibacteriaceae bacterium]
MNLTRDQIVTAALGILDAYGLPDVSMRRIGSTLGVQPSALYWHFTSKQELLAAMAEVILGDLPQFSHGDFSRIAPWAARFHALLTRHKDGAELVWSVLCLGTWEDSIGYQVEQGLCACGVRAEFARTGAAGILHLVLGRAFDDDQRAQAVRLGVVCEPDSSDRAQALDDAIAIFVAGLQARSC